MVGKLQGRSLTVPGDASLPPPPVILISVDTLRADHLSCYGYRGRPTSNIDALAEGGTLFSGVSSPVPLTLPSHVSLLTSTYPFSHGVEDNGQQLGPQAETLAAALSAHGYHTAAFVGSFILDRRFGLNKGFDFYDSPFDLHQHEAMDPSDIKRLGEEVEHAAEQWLEKNSRKPFFLFLHLYDLHTPYNLPAAAQTRFKGSGYQAELAYVDDVLGRFWAFLRQQGIWDKSLVILTSDHGEGLGDHGESNHGYFVYQSTLWVPLLMHWPAMTTPFGRCVEDPVSLLDVAPTILQFLGEPRPSRFQGRSLLSLLKSKPSGATEDVYSESLYGHNHFGVSALRSLRVGRYKYIEAPNPEFYDLIQDPAEMHNLFSHQKSLALTYRERLHALRSRFGEAQRQGGTAVSPEVAARLASLGYAALSRPHTGQPEEGPDPKDRLADFERYNRAIALSASGQLLESNQILRQLVSNNPELVDLRIILALNMQKEGRYAEAVDELKEGLKQDPQCLLAHFDLAVSYVSLQRLDDAAKEAQAALALAPFYTRAEELLGTVRVQQKDYGRARSTFQHLLTIDPANYVAHYNLGVLAAMDGKWQEAERHLGSALATAPQSAEAHNTLGSIYFQRADLDRAGKEFVGAIHLQPQFTWAHYNLGTVFRQEGKTKAAAQEFRQALASDPSFHLASDALNDLEHRQR